jgi:hypothetical protein
MGKPFRLVPQEDEHGCGIACVASILGVDYGVARAWLGGRPSKKGLFASTLCKVVERQKRRVGQQVRYQRRSWKTVERWALKVGTLAMVRAHDHFIVWTNKGWMDPWSNNWRCPPKATYRRKSAGKITTVWIPM